MKQINFLFVVLMVIAVSLLSVTSALAADEHDCMHLDHSVQSLRMCVSHAADMGHIDNRGVANSLLAKLDSAQAALTRGQSDVAVAKLQAFVHEVEAQLGKHIDATHGSHMIMHAEMVISNPQ